MKKQNKWANTRFPPTIYKAFTLVELIVVITILAILGTIAFISLQGYSRDARDSTRTADLGNMKTSLELYSLKTGKYPKPDTPTTITSSGDTVWYQGIVGDGVTTNLKSLNEKPLDPLLNTPYIYSTTSSFKEYQILAMYEGSVAYIPLSISAQGGEVASNNIPSPLGGGLGRGLIPQANAAGEVLTPKLVGTYNGVYVQTTNYIIPTPSIVTSDPSMLTLTGTTIKSQVITNGTNIPKIGSLQAKTGALLTITNFTIAPKINKNSTDAQKITAIKAIQDTYSGSSISTQENIAYILNQTSTGQILALTDITLLKGQSNLTSNTSTPTIPTPPAPSKQTVLNCGTGTGVLYGTLAGTDVGLTCSDDIIICNGTTGSGYTISACNAGAITPYTNQAYPTLSAARTPTLNTWMGGLYQWGNNADISMVTTTAGQIAATQIDSTYSGAIFRTGYPDWVLAPKNDNLWGNATNTKLARIGPCNAGYHIPTQSEWSSVFTTMGPLTQTTYSKTNQLKIPAAGSRHWNNASLYSQGAIGFYWSSSPNGTNGYTMSFSSTNLYPSGISNRAIGFSVRCFKN